ncbi:MAG: sugar MFS transporter [Bacteroidia bacterium]
MASTTTRITDHVPGLLFSSLLLMLAGVLSSLNDILNPALKDLFHLSYAGAALVHFSYYIAPVLMTFPGGFIIERIGHPRAALLGISNMALACLLFLLATQSGVFGAFLGALFLLALGASLTGLTINSYSVLLGSSDTANGRLTLTNAFYAVGTTLGPLFASGLMLSGQGQLALPYVIMSGVLAVTALAMWRSRLPRREAVVGPTDVVAAPAIAWWKQRHFRLGVLAELAYSGVEVTTASLLIKYLALPQVAGLPEATGGYFLSFYWGGLMVGRFAGVLLNKRFSPQQILSAHALAGLVCIVPVIAGWGQVAMIGILSLGLAHSSMFPAIFTLSLAGLGRHTQRAAGLLLTASMGGAIFPVLQGSIADKIGLPLSFVVILIAYLYILYFGRRGYRPRV